MNEDSETCDSITEGQVFMSSKSLEDIGGKKKMCAANIFKETRVKNVPTLGKRINLQIQELSKL